MDGYTAMQQIATPGDYLEDPDPMNLKHILHQVSGRADRGHHLTPGQVAPAILACTEAQ